MRPHIRDGLASGRTPDEADGTALDTRSHPTTPTPAALRARREVERLFDRRSQIDPARHRRAVQRCRAAWRELGIAIDALDDVDAEDV